MANSAGPDKPTDLDLHCLQRLYILVQQDNGSEAKLSGRLLFQICFVCFMKRTLLKKEIIGNGFIYILTINRIVCPKV